MTSEISILKPYGYQRKNSCGYCKNETGSSSYYMECKKMRVDHYQYLVDRGWRRSGILYYKPDLIRSCCPHYTIRLEAAQFKAGRNQRQAIHRLNSHILGSEYKNQAAVLCPQNKEEKRQKRDKFILSDAVGIAQYANVKKPTNKKTGKPIEPAHRFEVNLEADNLTTEKYDVFLRYQKEVHKDPVSRWPEAAFKRFLCGGLDRKTIRSNGVTQKLGSYHMCYRLDGKLVALGVLDLLPHAVSSVYLFYDPDFEQWDLGKVSTLYEIDLAVKGHYGYYYMGYYIHSCIKMRYKGTFTPSYLLDPETFEWNIFDVAYREKLDKSKYVSPSSDRNPVDQPSSDGAASSEPELSSLEDTLGPSVDTTKSRASKYADDKDLEFEEEDSDNEDAEIPEGSLFDYNIPGIMTKDEVGKLDLNHWKLIVRNSLVDLEDLRGWEDSAIDDPGSIKGISAELIAATGPGLLQNSALDLF